MVSADGTRVVFYSDSDFLEQTIPDDQNEIWLYDHNTMALTRLTTASDSDRDSFSPSISADGSKIVFQSDSDFLGQGIPDNQVEIWLYDTTTLTLTRLTTATGADRGSFVPSLSADGARIAFVSDADFLGEGIPNNQFEIWLLDLNTNDMTRLTTASSSDRRSSAPSLSADGTKVAFRSDSDFLGQGIPNDQNEIWLYDTMAMTLTRLTAASDSTRSSFSPSVSADGTKIAFYSDSDFLGQGIAQNQIEVWWLDTSTMILTRVTTASDPLRSSMYPQVSADGSTIVFHSDSDFLGQGIQRDQDEIWLYDTTSMTLTRVTTASESLRSSSFPSISANGSKIAFQSNSDFLNQGIPIEQYEIWLWTQEFEHAVYLPFVVKP